MALIIESGISIRGILSIPKQEGLKKEGLIVAATGRYQLSEMPDRFVIKNAECCRSIMVKVMTND